MPRGITQHAHVPVSHLTVEVNGKKVSHRINLRAEGEEYEWVSGRDWQASSLLLPSEVHPPESFEGRSNVFP